MLNSDDLNVINEGIDSMLKSRKETIQKLIETVDPDNSDKYNEITRKAAAYLLGEMRAIEAIDVLLENIFEPKALQPLGSMDRLDSPVENALHKIGRPIIPAVTNIIENSDKRYRRIKATDFLVVTYADKDQALLYLTKRKQKAKDNKKIASRIDSAIDHVNKHFKVK
ncbi:MAG: hypothetical protein FVQ82_16660 [Planctomycetes bacterium]|nr:hypothetical protein [Planctomycetota bacterium]